MKPKSIEVVETVNQSTATAVWKVDGKTITTTLSAPLGATQDELVAMMLPQAQAAAASLAGLPVPLPPTD